MLALISKYREMSDLEQENLALFALMDNFAFCPRQRGGFLWIKI